MIVSLCLLVCLGAPGLANPADAAPSDAEFKQFLFYAVLEGLFEQGLPDATVDRLLQRDAMSGNPFLFVYGCPICHPTYDALRLYRSRQPMWGDKRESRDFANKLEPALLKRLNADDPAVRAEAFGSLVERFVAARIAASRFTPTELEAWRKKLEEGKQRGEEQLKVYQAQGNSTYSWMKSCSMCQGANRGAK